MFLRVIPPYELQKKFKTKRGWEDQKTFLGKICSLLGGIEKRRVALSKGVGYLLVSTSRKRKLLLLCEL